MTSNFLTITRSAWLVVATILTVSLAPAASAHAATVTTEYPDYAPGEAVVMTGSGWLPGEVVTLTLSEDGGHCEDRTYIVVADEYGEIYTDEFVVEEHDIGVTFTLTAVGELSDEIATTTFTDACPGGFTRDESCTNANTGPCAWGCRQIAGMHSCHVNATAPAPAATVCRAEAPGGCDIAEVCDGTATTCPADASQPNGTECDDSDACNVGETCQAGSCTGGSAPDCSSEGDQCNDASCDSAGDEGNCDTLTPVADDTDCDDGDACNVGESCQAGSCTGGSAPDCSSAGNQCNTASCNASGAEGNCSTLTPVADDTNCDDDDVCNVGESCQAGVCTGGSPPDCSNEGNQCNTASCAADGVREGNCDTLTPVADDTDCDDGDACNVGESCQTGSCTGGTAPDCSTAGNQCNTASCDASGAEGNCSTLTPVADDTDCDDSDACNVGESCQSGSCTGGDAPDCSAAGDQCNTASCDASGAEGNCATLTPVADDTDCDDSDACNVGESCQIGSCTGGSAPDCSTAGDQCNTASCDVSAAEGNCDTITPANEDGACDDEDACTENETCQSGNCTDGTDVDCDDGASCTTDSCDSETGCANEPDDDACNDDNVCTADACDPDAVGADETTGCDYSLDAESGCEAAITSSSLCPFDIDPDADPEDQFRLIFTPDQSAPSSWKLNASNPGQFYYNAMYVGAGEETLEIYLPYPFVTQGANPVHIYESVTPDSDGCYAPGDELGSAKTLVVLTDYAPQQIGSTTTIGVELPSLAGHFAYVNIHLDYGLKRTPGYSKNAGNDAVSAANLSSILIPDETDYEFSDSVGGSDTAQSNNVFKRDPGFAGLVLDNTLTPVANVKVEIRDATNKLLKVVYTDEDGWYMWQYKYTGKAATFYVKLPDNGGLQQTVTLKSNQLVVVNFTLP